MPQDSRSVDFDGIRELRPIPSCEARINALSDELVSTFPHRLPAPTPIATYQREVSDGCRAPEGFAVRAFDAAGREFEIRSSTLQSRLFSGVVAEAELNTLACELAR